ncbi:FoF1 ATP synthase subunit gamma [Marivita sp. S2033]|uniref:F0F1 ATP synthase subunit gamma n=1 Tax=Marivita sp. S2033 TaxID=3373187 RepID=UPI0039826E79
MTQTLEVLTRRTGTMRSIRGIVRTMKTMSAINALPYEQAAQAIDGYRQTVLDGLHGYVVAQGGLPSDTPDDGPHIVIAFGSDHGLCGNYNEIVALEVTRALTARPGRVICVGAQMEDALYGQDIVPETTLMPPASVDGLGRLSGRLITTLDSIRAAKDGDAAAVSLVFMQRMSHGQQSAVFQALLPFDAKLVKSLSQRAWSSRSLPVFRLPPEQLLSALIRAYLFAGIFRAAAEALVTENAARLARMQQAERSIDDRLEALTGDMRSLRQSEITTELLDVIIGFEALKHDRRTTTATDDGSHRSGGA